jgi:hypothetical protein
MRKPFQIVPAIFFLTRMRKPFQIVPAIFFLTRMRDNYFLHPTLRHEYYQAEGVPAGYDNLL